MINKTTKKLSPIALAFIVVAIFADIFIWQEIFASGAVSGFGSGAASTSVARDYFLDVGQGDSELVIFPGNVKVMTDAGPDDSVLASLASAMPPGDDYIDVAIISHPQLDHFNGYNFILDHYRIGAFIYNGRDDTPGVKEWLELKAKIAAKGIPLITLGGGDKILIGAQNSTVAATSSPDEIDMLSPNLVFDQSAELNDTGLVELIKTPQFRTLLTADIGFNVEDWLVAHYGGGNSGSAGSADDANRLLVDNLHADVLKVPHHGSKYSSSNAFLRAVSPSVAVIEVGAKNMYGHPGSSTLARLASDTTALVLRTDKNGTVEVYPGNGNLRVVKGK